MTFFAIIFLLCFSFCFSLYGDVMDKEFHDKIMIYRDQIDRYDKEIERILLNRQSIVNNVGMLKSANGIENFMAVDREIDILYKMLNKLSAVYDKNAIISIYRAIITSSLFHENKFSCVAQDLNSLFLAREFFTSVIPCKIEKNYISILNNVTNNIGDVGAMKFPHHDIKEKWWLELCNKKYNNVKVFAVSPIIPNEIVGSSLLITRVKLDYEKISNTRKLFIVKNKSKLTNILDKNDAEILDYLDDVSLISIDNILTEDLIDNSDDCIFIGLYALM